tara:strand:+ start:433 stop:582 length:150 start_codon:yes stop_codon:yes gene_type:complete
VKQFQTQGFFFIPNPFSDVRMREADHLQAEIWERWSNTQWLQAFNRLTY